MKKHIHIILAIIILILGVVIAYLYFGKFQNNEKISEPSETVEMPTSAPTVEPTTEPMDESTPEDMDTLTNADRGVASGDMVISIDWNSINPATHSTYDSETNTVTIDDTMWNYMYENCPAFDLKPLESTKALLSIYLVDYYGERFGDNEWLQFAITGDTTHLNLSVTDAELLIMSDQLIDEYLQTEEGQQAQQDFESQFGTKEDRDEARWQKLADRLGITVEEAKALYGGGNSGGSNNGGGGSSPIANPDTQQPGATEDNYVTPETDNPGNSGNTGGSGGNGNGNAFDGWGNNEGNDGGDLVGPDIIWN